MGWMFVVYVRVDGYNVLLVEFKWGRFFKDDVSDLWMFEFLKIFFEGGSLL